MPAAHPVDLSLQHPVAQSLVGPDALFFKWARPRAWTARKRIRYVLRIYESARGGGPKKIYEATIDNRERLRPKPADISLRAGRVYLWEVTACDRAGKPIGASRRSRFGYRTDFVVESAMPARLRRPDFVPAAPHVFGCPVRMRPRAALDAPCEPEPGEPGGDVAPKQIAWGSTAAYVFLIPHLWRNCAVRWDYSGVAGCDRVLLQMAPFPGFAYPPNSPDVLTDPNVAAALVGPPAIACYDSYERDLTRADNPRELYASSGFNLLDAAFWDEPPLAAMLRLVPLRADGTLADIASDPTTVICAQTWPGIVLSSLTVSWWWGEAPRRVVNFEIELVGDFVPESWGVDAPSAILFHVTPEHVETREATIDGAPVAHETTVHHGGDWTDFRAHVFELDAWERGRRLRGRVVQEMKRLSRTAWTVQPLIDFIEADVAVECYPGIAIDWAYCGGPLTADPCAPPSLSSPEECGLPLNASHGPPPVSCWDDVFAFFDATLTGTRRVRTIEERRFRPDNPPEDGDETDTSTWRSEVNETARTNEDVTVRFAWPGDPRDGADFRGSLLRSAPATMTETVGATNREYQFKLYAGGATMEELWGERRGYHGDRPYEMGGWGVSMAFDRLELNFRHDLWAETVHDEEGFVTRYLLIDYVLDR